MNEFSASSEMQEPEIRGLKGEVAGLKTIILAKKTECESMILKTTEKKLLDLQRLTESYSSPRDLTFERPCCAAISPLTKPHEATPGLQAQGPQGGAGTGGRSRWDLACKD